MDKRQLRNIPTWKLALRFGSVFLVIVLLIELMVGVYKTGNLSFIKENITNGQWLTYVISRIILGVTYGFVMAFLTKKQVKK